VWSAQRIPTAVNFEFLHRIKVYKNNVIYFPHLHGRLMISIIIRSSKLSDVMKFIFTDMKFRICLKRIDSASYRDIRS
jgi:hypothetical protein